MPSASSSPGHNKVQQSTGKRFTPEKPVLDLVFTVEYTAQSVEKQFYLVHGFAKEINLFKSKTTVVVNTFARMNRQRCMEKG
jgi:hypothetical protein